MSISRFSKFKFLLIPLLLITGGVITSAVTNVSTHVTGEDRLVFELFYGQNSISSPEGFNDQIQLISNLQKKAFEAAPVGSGIPEYQEREPQELIRAKQGLCYDRSRTLDKLLSFVGFKTRHVYLLYKQDRSFLSAISHYGQESHAVTEVKTAKGWMLVDSNTPWLAITRGGEPVSADVVWKLYDEFKDPPTYFKEPYWAIRGMYSRKGHLYKPYIYFPEFNWPTFFEWVIHG